MRRETHKHLEDLPGGCNTVVGDMLSELTRLEPNTTAGDDMTEASKTALPLDFGSAAGLCMELALG